MVIGFTGTQQGMTVFQMDALCQLLAEHRPSEFHHGDCVGADYQAHTIAKELGIKIVIHPPANAKARAYCSADLKMPEKPYLERNHNIVDCSDLIIAAPKSQREQLRSGTWATVRYTRKQQKELIILATQS